jgi:hypothetical protein
VPDDDVWLIIVAQDHVLDIPKLVAPIIIELHLIDLRGRHRLALTLGRRGWLSRPRRVLTCRWLVGGLLTITLLIPLGLGLLLGASRFRLLVGAHSDEAGRGFRAKAAACTD